MLSRRGVPENALTELSDELLTAERAAEVGARPHLTGMLADLLRRTLFGLDSAAAQVLTPRGSRPGDLVADLLVAFGFAAYLRTAEAVLTEKGLGTELLRGGRFTLTRLAPAHGVQFRCLSRRFRQSASSARPGHSLCGGQGSVAVDKTCCLRSVAANLGWACSRMTEATLG